MLETGGKAPDVTLTDADEHPFSLSRHAGKRVVVYFYPKADTPGCTNEAKDFTALAKEFAAAGVPVIGVSKDKPAKLAKFRDKYGLGVTLASDEDGSACEAFGHVPDRRRRNDPARVAQGKGEGARRRSVGIGESAWLTGVCPSPPLAVTCC